jgi:hypothetical protein
MEGLSGADRSYGEPLNLNLGHHELPAIAARAARTSLDSVSMS